MHQKIAQERQRPAHKPGCIHQRSTAQVSHEPPSSEAPPCASGVCRGAAALGSSPIRIEGFRPVRHVIHATQPLADGRNEDIASLTLRMVSMRSLTKALRFIAIASLHALDVMWSRFMYKPCVSAGGRSLRRRHRCRMLSFRRTPSVLWHLMRFSSDGLSAASRVLTPFAVTDGFSN